MGINAFTAKWMLEHFSDGLFSGMTRIAEFGPQDFLFCRNYMKVVAATLFPDPAAAKNFYDKIFPENSEQCARDSQKNFYKALGFSTYKSIDFYDDRADYQFDINYIINMRERFDVITNFGTAEHLSNIGSIFASTHNLLNKNGLALFILPAMGHITHGFFNIHPILFKALAYYNKYEIVEYTYVDNAQGRALAVEADPQDPAPFEDFLSVHYDEAFAMETAQRFKRNMEIEQGKAVDGQELTLVYDYNYVVLRKLENGRFTWPSQFMPTV